MVWNGKRAVSERVMVQLRTTSSSGLDLTFATEDVRSPTDWCFHEERHRIVIHLEGRLLSMECEFSCGPSARVLPEAGDIWMIPAGCRYAALAHGTTVSFAEIVLPTSLLADAGLPARVSHRDPFLKEAVSRAASLMGREDDLARMLLHTVTDGLKLHLLDVYGPVRGGPARRRRRRTLSGMQQARLRERIHGALDQEQSLEELALLADMTIHELLPAFREAFGLTPWQYIIRARLEAARRRLAVSRESVTEISLDVGFSSPSHFATAFRQHFGVTPSGFRRALRSP
ncbi:AraC family transcriptional regulator [Archangium violaceum]|uniref:helix-turn-helix domain-containing protein n=1 Tax=Archangium violaceum TaxID=83451 RepID=UPI002B29AF03|nr:AraC family transcriptional regulator [Archangium gephyra]